MKMTHASGGPGGRRGLAALVTACLAVAAVAACDPDDYDSAGEDAPPTVATAATPRITWGECPPLAEGAARDPRLRCATVKVPLDYKAPNGKKIDVAVSKLATAQQGKRRGVLVLNPGGPALPGLDMPGTMAPTLPESVLAAYDLIGFDPRGVEHSTPQSCGLTDPSVAGLFPYPAADGSITENASKARADAKQCASTAGKDLRFFTTANTARDLDRVREALGEKKISYWGQSYGTYLGTVYESLFPQRADRVILEGNVDPTKVWAQSAASWGKGMSERFPDAAAVAVTQGLGATADEVTQTYLELADKLDKTPASIPGAPVRLTGALLRNITYSLLLHNDTLQVLPQFWKAATDLSNNAPTEADGQVLQQIFAPAPQTPNVPADNQATMFLALTCGDAQWPRNVDDYAKKIKADREEWPLTAGMPVNIWACAFWPPPIEKPVSVSANGPRNTLILQNRRDNATPWDEGKGLYRVLGHRAAFVGADNGGHYVWHEGSDCVDQATVTFLTTGKLPAKEVYCTDVKQG